MVNMYMLIAFQCIRTVLRTYAVLACGPFAWTRARLAVLPQQKLPAPARLQAMWAFRIDSGKACYSAQEGIIARAIYLPYRE